jgi:hypothetical protein
MSIRPRRVKPEREIPDLAADAEPVSQPALESSGPSVLCENFVNT